MVYKLILIPYCCRIPHLSQRGEDAAKRALKSHGNYIVDHEKYWKNHGIVFLNICGIPVMLMIFLEY